MLSNPYLVSPPNADLSNSSISTPTLQPHPYYTNQILVPSSNGQVFVLQPMSAVYQPNMMPMPFVNQQMMQQPMNNSNAPLQSQFWPAPVMFQPMFSPVRKLHQPAANSNPSHHFQKIDKPSLGCIRTLVGGTITRIRQQIISN